MGMSYTKQYNPIPTVQTAQGDSLSIRTLRDLADGVNNYKACVGNHPLICETFTHGSSRQMQSQDYGEWGGSTGSLGDYPTLIAVFHPVYIPHGYDYFSTQCCANIPSGNVGTAQFWLYCLDRPYKTPGEPLFSASGYQYGVATWVVNGSSTDYQPKTAYGSLVGLTKRYVHFVLVSDHTPTGASRPRANIVSLTVRPMFVERI